MWTCRPSAGVAIKIEVEIAVEFQPIGINVDDMDFVAAFRIHDSAGRKVFDEKVIRHHQPLLITREAHIAAAGAMMK